MAFGVLKRLPLFAAVLFPFVLKAQTTATWIGTSMGSELWNDPANWMVTSGSGMFPNGNGSVANFNGVGSGITIALGQQISLGELNIMAGTYTIGDSNSDNLTFSVTNPSILNISAGAGLSTLIGFFEVQTPLTFTNSNSTPAMITGDSIQATADLTIAQGEFDFISNESAESISSGTLIVDSSGTFGNMSETQWGGISGAGTINLFNGAIFHIDTSGTSTFDGSFTLDMMSGGGNLDLIGTGTVVLTGMNSIGQIDIERGTLSVSSAANLGGPEILNMTDMADATLQATGTFSFGNGVTLNGNTATFDVSSGAVLTLTSISESVLSQVRKTSGGTLTLSGANSYSGATTVNGGRLNVNGAITSDTTVNAGGILGGNGTVQAATSVGGTIAPGTSVGTLTLTGPLSFDSSSTFLVEINPSASSQLSVMDVGIGNMTVLAGHVSVTADPGSYPPSGQYTILTTNDPITGMFNPTVISSSPGFTFSLTQEISSVLLNFTFVAPPPAPSGISTAGLKGNTAKFARYLNKNVPNSSATLALAALSGTALKDALNSASPARNAFATYVNQNTLFAVSEIVSNHLFGQRFYHTKNRDNSSVASLFSELDDSQLTADASQQRFLSNPACNKYSFWAGGFGEYSHQKSQDQNPAFHFLSGGAIVGFDYYRTGKNLFGLGGGYAYTHLIENHDAGHAKINSYFATIYDTFYSSNGYFELAAMGAYVQDHNYRHISFPGFDATASATLKSWQLVPHVGFGVDWRSNCSAFEPFAQADCAISWQQSYREHGAGAFDMRQDSRTSEFLRGEGGFRLYQFRETGWGAWLIMEKFSYVYKKMFGTGRIATAIVGTDALFSVESFRGAQNLGSAGLEMLWRFGCWKPVTFSLAYNGEMGSKYMSHEGYACLTKDF